MAEWTSMINGSQTEVKKAEGYRNQLYTFPYTWKDNLTVYGRSDVILNEQQSYKRLGMFIRITDINKY